MVYSPILFIGLGVVVARVACAIVLALTGGSRPPASAIEVILNRCAANSEKVNSSALTPGEAARFVVSEMQDMDTRDCPPEFRSAFEQHLDAWRESAQYLDDNSTLGHQNASYAREKINSTYYRLIDTATVSGARVPKAVIIR